MMNPFGKMLAYATLALALLLASTSAHAFRCGNKIVRDGMHEAQVLNLCGEPTTKRQIGRAIRGVDVPYIRHRAPGGIVYRTPGYGHFVTEVIITEYVYNFGPRKLMRRLLFEGGVLVQIDTIGYGYLE
jgi:hypothetical protein